MTVTFCGHRDIVPSEELVCSLRETVIQLVKEGADEFLLGGYGAFDRMAAHVVGELKRTYPQLQLCLILAYLDQKINSTEYDTTIFPPLESIPKKYAIIRRNRWMVENSDVVIACVNHGWGGAAATLSYAITKKKRIFQLGAYQI